VLFCSSSDKRAIQTAALGLSGVYSWLWRIHTYLRKRKGSYPTSTEQKKSNLILSDADRKRFLGLHFRLAYPYLAWILYNVSCWRHSDKPFLHTHPTQVFTQFNMTLSFRFRPSSDLIALSIDSVTHVPNHLTSRSANEGGSIRDESRHVRTWSGFIWRSLTISMEHYDYMNEHFDQPVFLLNLVAQNTSLQIEVFTGSSRLRSKETPGIIASVFRSVPWLLHSLENNVL